MDGLSISLLTSNFTLVTKKILNFLLPEFGPVFISEKVNKQLKYTLNPILRVFQVG
jgi:hypothetical protein